MFLGTLRIDVHLYRRERRAAHAANFFSPKHDVQLKVKYCI